MGPRFLIVNVNWIGDVLFSTPAIRAIRKAYPKAYLACLVPPRCESLLRGNPYLDQVITYEDRRMFVRPRVLKTLSTLRKTRFDTALYLHTSISKALLARIAGIPERLGYRLSSRDYLLTRTVPLPKERLHKTDFFLNLLQQLGIPSDGRTPDFFPEADAVVALDALLSKHGIRKGDKYAVVHAGGNWDLKRWPAAHFAEWIRLFTSEHSMKVVLCGTKGEEDLTNRIVTLSGGKAVSLCGQTSIDMLAVLLKNAQVLLSNDSGPIHLAASQGTRIVGLFGPTSPEETGPLSGSPARIMRKDVGCEVPCYFSACDYRVCMEWLTPDEVFSQTQQVLSAPA